MTSEIRTRIAPSPTGFLHLGTARTALFCWAYARHFGGQFILRVEDTDVERSTQAAVDQIIEAMDWLELKYDEGPFYQMQRIARYQEAIAKMLADGTAYRCYSSKEEVDAMRAAATERGDKPRYDGTWRPEAGKVLPPVPADRQSVVRFKNPQNGEVVWQDMVKGEIRIGNKELDDLVIARAPTADEAAQNPQAIGVPTYNFCVVVDDWDMRISHVIRGDDHVNNTPRQINILAALGAVVPQYGHVPMILGPDKEKLSKRHGAVSVTQYRDAGYLPSAMANYLSRLGWSHGDDEVFTPEKLVEWFDGKHLAKSPAQWDAAKLNWVNAQHIKALDDQALAAIVLPQLGQRGIASDARLPRMCGLVKDRCETTVAMADWAAAFYAEPLRSQADYALHITEATKPAVAALAVKLADCAWDKASIALAIKEVLAATGLKMPQLAMPARVLLMGKAQTPALDAVLELLDRNEVLARLAKV